MSAFPVILHFVFKNFADLEVIDILSELSFDQVPENIFEVNLAILVLVSWNLITPQHHNNVLILHDNSLFLVNEVTSAVEDLIALQLELLGSELELVSQIFVAEWRWQLDNDSQEITNMNPAGSFWVIVLPEVNEFLHVVSFECTRVLLARGLKTLDDSSNCQVDDQPSQNDEETKEVDKTEVITTASEDSLVSSEDLVVLVIDAPSSAIINLRELVHDFVPILTSTASKEIDDGSANILEIVLVGQIISFNYSTKLVHTQGSVDEQKQEHEGDEVSNLWKNDLQGVEDDLDFLLRTNQSDDSHNSKRSDNSGCS